MFDVIEDPRSGNATRHPFGSILFIALCAMLCGMDHCEDFVRFAKAREAWLKQWIALPNGIPCGNTFLRVFAAIDPAAFTECLAAFVTRICPELAGKLVAIDGKTLRGSRKADESTVQIVSAWASQRPDARSESRRHQEQRNHRRAQTPAPSQPQRQHRQPRRHGSATQNRHRHHPSRSGLPVSSQRQSRHTPCRRPGLLRRRRKSAIRPGKKRYRHHIRTPRQRSRSDRETRLYRH